jgi:uncharacterized protein
MSKLPDLSAIDITPLVDEGTNLITSYSNLSVSINNIKIYNKIAVSKFELSEYKNDSQLLQFLSNLLSNSDKLVILYGSDNSEKREDFKSYKQNSLQKLENISTEILSIGAACRTFNILMTEDRNAVLIIDF